MRMFEDIGARSLAYFIIGMVVTAAVLALCSCSTTQYVPVETVRTEYVNRTDTFVERDTVEREKTVTIMEADSALLAEYGVLFRENSNKQSSILVLQKEVERRKSSKQEVHNDTIVRTDVVQVPYPVERKLSKWEQLCVEYGKIMLGMTVAAIAVIVVLVILWRRKKR